VPKDSLGANAASTAHRDSGRGERLCSAVADLIHLCAPRVKYVALGTDGFGPQRYGAALRAFFEVDARNMGGALAALRAVLPRLCGATGSTPGRGPLER